MNECAWASRSLRLEKRIEQWWASRSCTAASHGPSEPTKTDDEVEPS